jgi:site-specific recombinase XerD
VRLLGAVDGKNRQRDYAILVVFLNTGIRLSELVGINLTDIQNNKLRVLGKGNKERIVYLNDACIDAINSYMQVRPVDGVIDKKALFLSNRRTRISHQMVQNLVKKYIEKAGLDPQRYSTHKLRHTAATLMFQNGVDVRVLKEVLGHENLNTTQIYTHIESTELKIAAEANPISRLNTAQNAFSEPPLPFSDDEL